MAQQIYPDIQQTGYVQVQPNANIVVAQPTFVAPREWTHTYCGCCDDCGECCYAYFCGCCYLCTLTSRANESCFSCMFGGLVPLRTKIRTERKINGSIVGDYFAVSCCPFCAMVQMSKEARDTKPLI